MTTVKRGHQAIASSLRPDEVTVLDETVAKMEEFRLWAHRTPERFLEHLPGGLKLTRAGFIRAAVRYALEHPDHFKRWMRNERANAGVDDAE